MGRHINYEQREIIKKVSFEMFLEYGYDNVTTRNIAEKCEITRALLHYYYNKKEILLIDIYLNLVREANVYFLETLSAEQFENLDVGMFFKLFFGMIDIKPSYNNIYLPIYRDVNLIHSMLNSTVENYDFFLADKPFSDKKRLAMFAISGIFSQLILLLINKKLDMTTKEVVEYAMKGYYFYLGMDVEESQKLLDYMDSQINEAYIRKFIRIFEEKMK